MTRRCLLSAVALAQLLVSYADAAERVYVTNGSDDTVSVIDVATDTVTATIPLDQHGPIDLAVTPDGNRAYVTNLYSDTISVLDTVTNTSIATIPLDGHPAAIAIAPNGRFAYVAANGLIAVDLATNSAHVVNAGVSTILFVINTLGEYIMVLSSIAFTPDGRFAYVTGGHNTVGVVDTATGSVSATIPAIRPTVVAVAPSGEFAYLACQLGTVSVVETRHNSVVATVSVGPWALGIATSSDGGHVYVAQNAPSAVGIIDTRRNEVTATVSIPGSPSAIAVSRSGRAYARNLGDTVSVIDTASNSNVDQVKVGRQALTTATGIAVTDGPTGSDGSGCAVVPHGSRATWWAAVLLAWLIVRRCRRQVWVS